MEEIAEEPVGKVQRVKGLALSLHAFFQSLIWAFLPPQILGHERQVGQFLQRHGRQCRMLQRVVTLVVIARQVIEEKLQYRHGMPPRYRNDALVVYQSTGWWRLWFYAAMIARIAQLFN
ncbi:MULTISPECIES: hypothetical protein [Rhizobium]|uniref:Uncharacterized protein n=1 Tax=Rhizobium paranaense TaxID=1650438 RepID=A0A7W9CZ37_9HYPH|nr:MULTISPECIES: hypothetical protein [Rhizobium]MBB5571802.1 hypothetical protein [Rhizobium paranaense]